MPSVSLGKQWSSCGEGGNVEVVRRGRQRSRRALLCPVDDLVPEGDFLGALARKQFEKVESLGGILLDRCQTAASFLIGLLSQKRCQCVLKA